MISHSETPQPNSTPVVVTPTPPGNALLEAAKTDDILAAEKILSNKDQIIDPHWYYPHNGFRGLHFAVQNKSERMVMILRRNNADETVTCLVDATDFKTALTPIAYAAYLGHWDVVLAFTVDINNKTHIENPLSQSGRALFRATQNNQPHVTRALLTKKADSTYFEPTTGFTGLHYAAQHNSHSMVFAYREFSANELTLCLPTATTIKQAVTPIAYAAIIQSWDAVLAFTIPVQGKTMIADPASQSGMAVMYAALNKKTAVVKQLIKLNALTTWFTLNDHNTPLHCAVINLDTEMLLDLRAHNADETKKNKALRTAKEEAEHLAKTDAKYLIAVKAFEVPVTKDTDTRDADNLIKAFGDTSKTHLVPEFEVNVANAIAGDEIAIHTLAKYYQNNAQDNKAILFTAIDTLSDTILEIERQEGKKYLNSKAKKSLWSKSNPLASLMQNACNINLIIRLKETKSVDIITLILVAAKLISQSSATTILLEETLISIFKDDMKIDNDTTYILLRSRTKAAAQIALNPQEYHFEEKACSSSTQQVLTTLSNKPIVETHKRNNEVISSRVDDSLNNDGDVPQPTQIITPPTNVNVENEAGMFDPPQRKIINM